MKMVVNGSHTTKLGAVFRAMVNASNVFVCFCFSAFFAGYACANAQAVGPHMSVELMSDHAQITEGSGFRIGVNFVPEDGWHIYWLNPGDTGLAPEINWTVSGAKSSDFSEIQWPFPELIKVAHLTDYGMHGQTLLFSNASIQRDNPQQSEITIHAKVSWLVCQESCIPGDANLSLSLPLAQQAQVNLSKASYFEQASSAVPQKLSVLSSSAIRKGDHLDMVVYAQSLIFKDAKTVDVYVKNTNVVHNGEPLKISWRANRLEWQSALSEYFNVAPETIQVVLVIDGSKAYDVDIPLTKTVE